MNPRTKVAITISALSFFAGALYSHSTGTIYPGMPAAAGVSLLALFVAIVTTDTPGLPTLGWVVAIGLLYRVYLFLFPASLIGFDPDAYAVRALIVARSGSTAELLGDFYGQTGAFSVFNASSILLTGLPADLATIVTPAVTAFVIPLSAAAIAKQTIGTQKVAVLAALITTLGPASVKFSTRFTPVLFSALLFTAFAVLILTHSSRKRPSHLVLFGILLATMAVTHKIALAIVAGSSAALVLASLPSVGNAFGRDSIGTPLILTGISGCLLYFQWGIVTDYIGSAVDRLLIIATLSSKYELSVPRTAAVQYNPGLVDVLVASGFVFTTLGLGGVIWAYTAWKHRFEPPVARILALVAATVGVAFPGLYVSAAGGFQRTIFFATASLGALIAVGYFFTTIERGTVVQYVCLGCLVLLLVSQPASNISSPDYRDSTRQYLTQGEVTAKQFAQSTTDLVWMDAYYQDEVVDFETAAANGGPEYQSQVPNPRREGLMTRELTNATLLEHGYGNILLRTDVGVYRMDGGRWVLTWDPVQTMATSTQYHQTYQNGAATLFSNREEVTA